MSKDVGVEETKSDSVKEDEFFIQDSAPLPAPSVIKEFKISDSLHADDDDRDTTKFDSMDCEASMKSLLAAGKVLQDAMVMCVAAEGPLKQPMFMAYLASRVFRKCGYPYQLHCGYYFNAVMDAPEEELAKLSPEERESFKPRALPWAWVETPYMQDVKDLAEGKKIIHRGGEVMGEDGKPLRKPRTVVTDLAVHEVIEKHMFIMGTPYPSGEHSVPGVVYDEKNLPESIEGITKEIALDKIGMPSEMVRKILFTKQLRRFCKHPDDFLEEWVDANNLRLLLNNVLERCASALEEAEDALSKSLENGEIDDE